MNDLMRDDLAAAYAATCTHGSLHSADPAGNGANEVVRGAFAWAVVAGQPGVREGVVELEVPTGVTVTHGGLWNAGTGGTFRDGGALPTPFTGPGTYRLTARYTQLAGS